MHDQLGVPFKFGYVSKSFMFMDSRSLS